MTRLPCYDNKQSRGEKIAFLTLNVVAVAMVGMALLDASRFAVQRGEISQMVSSNRIAKGNAALLTNDSQLFKTSTPCEQTAGAPRPEPPKS